jgi:phosphatidylserine/phosphatidylglycerophosphate/cardiolipin synthase-like enzyme
LVFFSLGLCVLCVLSLLSVVAFKIFGLRAALIDAGGNLGNMFLMPKGVASILAVAFLAGGVLLARELGSSQSGSLDSSALTARFRELEASGPAADVDGIAVYFSPRGGCEEAVVDQIHKAQHSIDMQAYTFTASAISEALVEAEGRGVAVRVIMDKNGSNERGSQAEFLKENGVPIWTDGEHPIAHNKIVILDGNTVITGSFNFTNQAENLNAENLLVISGKPALATAYEQNFSEHLGHSEVFTGSDGGDRGDDR